MERIKVRELREAIAQAKAEVTDPIDKDMLWKLELVVKTSPAEFLRVTKMYESVNRIRKAVKYNDSRKRYRDTQLS